AAGRSPTSKKATPRRRAASSRTCRCAWAVRSHGIQRKAKSSATRKRIGCCEENIGSRGCIRKRGIELRFCPDESRRGLLGQNRISIPHRIGTLRDRREPFDALLCLPA